MQNKEQNISITRGTAFSSGGNVSPRVMSRPAQSHQQYQESPHSHSDRSAKSKKATAIFDWLITISIAALFFGIPVFFTGLTFQGVVFEKQIYFYFWLLLALVSWASKGVITGEMKIKRTPLDIPIIIFWLLYILSTAFSVDKWHSLWGFFGDPSRGLLGVTGLIIAFYLILSHFDSRRIKWVIGSLVASNVVITAWTLLGLLGTHFLPQRIMELAPLSMIGSIIGLGIYFSAMIPMLIAVIIKTDPGEEKRSKKKYAKIAFLLMLTLLNLFILLMTFSFNPWLGVLVGVSVVLIFVLSQIVRPADGLIWVPMVVFVGILSILMIGNNSLARINLPVEASPSYKLSWDIAKGGAMDKFFTGSGPATYGYDFSKFKTQDFNLNSLYSLKFFQGTGMIFETLPTIGVLGTIVLIVILLSFVSVGIYFLVRDKEKNKIYALGFFAASLVLIVDGLTNRIEGTIVILGVLLAAVSLGMLYKESEVEGKSLNLSLKASPKFALALAFVFMVVSAGVVFLFVFVGKAYLADVYMKKASMASQVIDDGSIKQMAQAVNLYGKEGRYYTRMGQEYMSLFNNEAMKKESDRDAGALQQYLNNSIALTSKGSAMMGNDVTAIEALAQVYENAGIYVPDSNSFAEDNYKRALELDPFNPNYQVKLGQLEVAKAATKTTEADKKNLVNSAKDYFQKSIDEKANFAIGYNQLALAQDALGDRDAAIDNMKKAFTLDQSNVNYAFSLAKLYQNRGNSDDLKFAEELFKQILAVNDMEINTHFSLGLLYEKEKRKDDAVVEYKKVIDLLPVPGSDDTKTQLQKMISNVQAGIENTPESIGLSDQSRQGQPQTSPASQPAPQSTPAQ